MWEFIPIMKGFYGIIIPLRLPINSLKSYEGRGDFFLRRLAENSQAKSFFLFNLKGSQRERE